jgi:hypothetical protein
MVNHPNRRKIAKACIVHYQWQGGLYGFGAGRIDQDAERKAEELPF